MFQIKLYASSADKYFFLMRPSRRLESSSYPGFSVRLGHDYESRPDSKFNDLAKLKELAELAGFRTASRFWVKIAIEIICLIEDKVFTIRDGGLLVQGRDSKPSAIWSELAVRDVRRSLPNDHTYPVKLSFLSESRAQLNELSCRLRWAEGQILMEALQTFAVLAGATHPFLNFEKLPDLLRVALAEKYFRVKEGKFKLTPEIILRRLNHGLGLSSVSQSGMFVTRPYKRRPSRSG